MEGKKTPRLVEPGRLLTCRKQVELEVARHFAARSRSGVQPHESVDRVPDEPDRPVAHRHVHPARVGAAGGEEGVRRVRRSR